MTVVNTTNAAIGALYNAELTWGAGFITVLLLAAAAFIIGRWF
ncbi:hypothetical protein ACYB2G_003275 [Salmonella enterica subsp. enterica serovar Chester]|jgi:hypothetical protein|nr:MULTISPECIES: hypothetical protein [Enterobacteriaceae]DAH66043.1 MAG TPA: hypothetical protein [Caudoviricetes sp.]MDP4360331.1 hypothetical protein [Escherichia coli]WNI78992.1 hypothetical protein RIK61_22810 [Enterobacter ludwigii]WNI83680.1 hypothetical protein RIK68_23805 [Enterobacter ludwigii]DAY52749.1 MAG TPA: hypothetical protein [Caudoviricetes sp.]